MSATREEKKTMQELNRKSRTQRSWDTFRSRTENDGNEEILRNILYDFQMMNQTHHTFHVEPKMLEKWKTLMNQYINAKFGSHKDIKMRFLLCPLPLDNDVYVATAFIAGEPDATWTQTNAWPGMAVDAVRRSLESFSWHELFTGNYATKLNLLFEKNEFHVKRKYKYTKTETDPPTYDCKCTFTYDGVPYTFEGSACKYRLLARYACDKAALELFTDFGFEYEL